MAWQHPGSRSIPENRPILLHGGELQQNNCKEVAHRGKAATVPRSFNTELLQATGETETSPFKISRMFSLATEDG